MSSFGSTPIQRTRRSLLSQTSNAPSPLGAAGGGSGSSTHSTPSRRPLAGSVGTPVAAASIGSATKPFDYAGNERAARRALETPTKLKVVVPGAASKRLIRKKPILQRIKDLPSTLLDRFDLSLDMDPLARPLGLALTALHFLLRAPLWSTNQKKRTSILRSSSKPVDRFDNRWESKTEPSSWAFSWTATLSILLCALAAANALYLFTRTRSYKMHLRTDPLNSPNARKVEEDDPFSSSKEEREQGWLDVLKWARANLSPIPVARFLLSLPPTSASKRNRRRLVPQLDVWDPPIFNQHLFSTYTPPSALVLHFLTPSAPFTAVVIALIVSFQSHMLVGKYGDLIKDREILQGEVMHEYDAKFVYPSIFKHRKDASTTTNQAEMVNFAW